MENREKGYDSPVRKGNGDYWVVYNKRGKMEINYNSVEFSIFVNIFLFNYNIQWIIIL